MISYIMINHQAYNFNKLLKNVEELTKSEVRSQKSEVRSQKFLTRFRHYRTEVVERNIDLCSASKTMRVKRRGFSPKYFR